MTRNKNCFLNQNKKKSKKNSKLKLCNTFLFSLLFVGIGFYLFNISQLASQGFILKELSFENNMLMAKKTDLEERLSFSQSYYSINSRVASLNMVEAKPEFLKISSSVAKK